MNHENVILFYYVKTSHCVKSVHVRGYPGPYSVRMRENKDQDNFEYGHFLRSVNRKPTPFIVKFAGVNYLLFRLTVSAHLWRPRYPSKSQNSAQFTTQACDTKAVQQSLKKNRNESRL